jgi:mannose-6-phosphate isomerase class I
MLSFCGKPLTEIQTWLVTHQQLEWLEQQVKQALFPLPDNFTTPSRAPWGGTRILKHYKHDLPIRPEKQFSIVGESWEVSADLEAPSQFVFPADPEEILIDCIQLLELFPEQILGTRVAQKFHGQNPLLVKILDAIEPLSVQVHPSDEYGGLSADESGKPECWFVLEAQEGSGLYLGLRDGVSSTELREAIEQRQDVSRYLNFVPVKPGDFFMIEAGTIHSIGGGVTLIETQKIAPKRSGKTYRLWDWNRLYDGQGHKSPDGEPRELHIEDSFHVINFNDARGEQFIAAVRPEQRLVQQQGGSTETLLIENEHFAVALIELTGNQPLPQSCADGFHGLIPFDGPIRLTYPQAESVEVPQGQSVILPASLKEYSLTGKQSRAIKVYYSR